MEQALSSLKVLKKEHPRPRPASAALWPAGTAMCLRCGGLPPAAGLQLCQGCSMAVRRETLSPSSAGHGWGIILCWNDRPYSRTTIGRCCYCGLPARMRDDDGRPAHKPCAESVLDHLARKASR
jgi:hypothetical protein